MSSAVEQIKAKLDIVELVSSYLKLEKAGVNWKARCPFHNERTPSFFVSPVRQNYHCFGCNRGGDLISFVEEMEGLDFLGALKVLAERTGVSLDQPSSHPNYSSTSSLEKQNEKTILYQVLNLANEYYLAQLKQNPEVLTYLESRGLTTESVKKFKLGFAPVGWQSLTDYLKSKKITDEAMIKSGLAIRSSKDNTRVYDRFRSRIMFPLADATGKIVGFSGRIWGEDDGSGKYINTPETALYHKSQFLYGYDQAKMAIRQNDECVLVEGYLDLMMAHQAGVTQAVAVSGTALTGEHLTLIRRLSHNLVIAFDGDAAGLAAAERSIALALAAGFLVRVVALPNNLDPADLVKEDPAKWREAVTGAKHVIDFLLDSLIEQKLDKFKLLQQMEQAVYPYLKMLKNPAERDLFIAKIALVTRVSENALRENIGKAPELRSEKIDSLSPEKSRADRILEQLFGLYWRGEMSDLIEQLPEFESEKAGLEARKDELALAADLAYAGMATDKLQAEVKTLLAQVTLEREQVKIEDLRAKLMSAEKENDEETSKDLLAKLQASYQKVSDLKNQ